MSRVDLHVHSRHSRHPAEWFLQRIGAQESYTDVEEVYRMAKARGMTWVTLTDHNTIDGALELHERHPDDTFVSVEVTAYFPQDGCKVHVLVYGIDAEKFAAIQARRGDVYRLRDWLRQEGVACSVAHATFSVNEKLTVATVEKLALLFDVFEGINGGRPEPHNESWMEALRGLTPERLAELEARHGIQPWGPSSWIKGLTAGSDDHAGLFVGQTWTEADAGSLPEFLDSLRQRRTRPAGRHSDHRSFACAVYKIAHEFSRAKGASGGGGAWTTLTALLFDNGRLGLREWLAVQKGRRGRNATDRILAQCMEDLIDGRSRDPLDSATQVERTWQALTGLSDGFFALIAESLTNDLQRGETGRLIRNLSASLPALFLLAPFLTVLRHQHGDHELRNGVAAAFGVDRARPGTLLWFTDTLTELNGVAVTLREVATYARQAGRPMKLVASLADHEDPKDLPPGTLLLPCIYDVRPGFYDAVNVRLPSLLRSLDAIAREEPSEIVISTPGPVGLVGLVAARLLRVRCTGVYHTDFTAQVDRFIGDPWVSSLVEGYTRRFFTLVDEVRVPTARYMDMLVERGIDRARMKMFRRGIPPEFAVHDEAGQAAWRARLDLPPGVPVLLWAGRLGAEKNLDFLRQVHRSVARWRPDTRLVLAGDGPEARSLRRACEGDPRIVFTGRLERTDLVHLYGLADVFVFPSTTDTFGMVVLEAQACGLPAIVSDVGGPQELVDNARTGFVVRADDLEAWTAAVMAVLDMRTSAPKALAGMRSAARARAVNGWGWDRLLDDMMGLPGREPGTGCESTALGVGIGAAPAQGFPVP